MLEFTPDHLTEYRGYAVTPVGFQKALPFCPTHLGEHSVGDRYAVRRDGRHDYLLIVTKGGAGYMTQRGQTVRLEAGSAVVIDCEPHQAYGTVPGETWHFRFIHFNALSIEGYRNALLSALTQVSLRDFDRVWTLMGEMYALCDASLPALHVQLSHAVSEILTEMVCSCAADGQEKGSRADMVELAAFIRENCVADLHVENFCTLTNLSRHHLIRLFESCIGVTPYRYMHLCRINRAQMLLLHNDRLSVEQIADAVGYVNAAVFIRHFKSFHGITPAAYRKEMRLT